MPSNFARYYDAVMNWEKRLARELPLLEEIARAAGSQVLVPACGTGGHVVGLAQRGFRALGFDIDEDALEIARQRINTSASLITAAGGDARVALLAMEHAHQFGPVYDAAFCLGNALPGLSARGQLVAALRGVAGALRVGGTFFTQNLNYDRRWREKARWFPLLAGDTRQEEVLLVKFADYEDEFINFHGVFLTRKRPKGAWQMTVRTSKQIPLVHDRLTALLVEAGFGNVQSWGDYSRSPFDPQGSNDLLVAATKL